MLIFTSIIVNLFFFLFLYVLLRKLKIPIINFSNIDIVLYKEVSIALGDSPMKVLKQFILNIYGLGLDRIWSTLEQILLITRLQVIAIVNGIFS